MHKKVAVGVLFLLLIIIIALQYRTEPFADRQGRAAAIHDWFAGAKNPTYVEFKADLAGQSNIVEYNEAMKLRRRGHLTVDNLLKVI